MLSVVALLSLFVVARGNGENYFDSVPSVYYFRRSDVFDCATRYYQSELTENSNGYKVVPAVLGGFRAFNSEYPHMAAIGWEIEGSIQYLCGGSIILPKFVLTAAHCSVEVNGAQPTTVRMGDTDLGNDKNDHLAQQRAIWRFVRHPLHRLSKNYHDIALVELEEEITVNDNVAPACLWLEDHIPLEPMRVVGFGEVEQASGPSLTLQQGRVMVQPSDTCEPAIINKRRLPDGLLDSLLCASHETMDTCQGDSGGPIEVRRSDMNGAEHTLIVGITSFGTPCVNGSTGVYTKVAAYVDWIENETNQTYEYGKCISRSRADGNIHYGITKLPADRPVPYVHLLKNQSADSHFNCMGTLIDDQFVLTSAFCAIHHGGYPKFIYIADNEERVEIEDVILHPHYGIDSRSNDIALLKLSKFLRQKLRPACLAEIEHPIAFLPTSIIMNSLDESIHNGSMQTKYYKRILHSLCTEPGDQICLKNSFPVIPRICQLLQGGPILMENPTDIPFVFGIIITKNSECNSNFHGISIEPHKEWIKNVLLQHLRREALIFT